MKELISNDFHIFYRIPKGDEIAWPCFIATLSYAYEYRGLVGQDDDVEVGEKTELPSRVLMQKRAVN